MAYNASILTLQNAFLSVNASALKIKQNVSAVRNLSAVGPVSRNDVLVLLKQLSNAITTWSEAAALPGIVQYVRDQFGDQAKDVSSEFTAMLSAATTLRDTIHTNYPKDAGSGADLTLSTDINGNVVYLTFSPAQMSGFRANADTLIAAIG